MNLNSKELRPIEEAMQLLLAFRPSYLAGSRTEPSSIEKEQIANSAAIVCVKKLIFETLTQYTNDECAERLAFWREVEEYLEQRLQALKQDLIQMKLNFGE